MSYPDESTSSANETDFRICFHCTSHDLSTELSTLGEPMSDIEQTFILEKCTVIDRETWINEFQQIKLPKPESSTENSETIPATSDALFITANNDAARDPSKLDECHICGISIRKVAENRFLFLR